MNELTPPGVPTITYRIMKGQPPQTPPSEKTHLDIQITFLGIRRQRKASTPKPIDGSRSFINNEQYSVLSIPLLQERRNLPCTLARTDFFFVEPVGEDDRSSRVEAWVLEEFCECFV
jgi:hypothetical protein